MKIRKEAEEIIGILSSGKFVAICPCCDDDDEVSLKSAGLFYLDNFTPEAEAIYEQRIEELRQRHTELRDRRKAVSRKSEIGAKAVNIGLMLERIAPAMRQFPFEPNDCRAIFKPIDYLIFEGLTEKSRVSKIIFVDIKTGNARLEDVQREVRSLVEKKRVAWETYKPRRLE